MKCFQAYQREMSLMSVKFVPNDEIKVFYEHDERHV